MFAVVARAILGNTDLGSWQYGPCAARSIPKRPRANIPQYGPKQVRSVSCLINGKKAFDILKAHANCCHSVRVSRLPSSIHTFLIIYESLNFFRVPDYCNFAFFRRTVKHVNVCFISRQFEFTRSERKLSKQMISMVTVQTIKS